MEGMLTCSLCFDIFSKPLTFPCFHSFCTTCIDKLPIESHEQPQQSGYLCPLCRSYTSQQDVKSNFLVTELLQMYRDSTEERVTCVQCVENAASQWKCVDCKIELCDKCHMSHLRIPVCRGHRVIPLDSETELIIDRLVFCSTHDDQPLILNCKECELPLCIKCKVTEHESHKTETVEKAVDRLRPLLLENKAALGLKLDQLHEELGQTQHVVQETKDIFLHCRDAIESQRQALIEKINREHQLQLETLQTKETIEVAKLQEKQTQIENKVQEYQMLQHWVSTTVEKTRGAILLVECQGGLNDKVARIVNQKSTSKLLTIEQPTYLPNSGKNQTRNLLGCIEYNKVTVTSVLPELPSNQNHSDKVQPSAENTDTQQNDTSVPSSSVNHQQGKRINASLTELFGNNVWTAKLEIKLPEGHCAKMTSIGNELWLPIFNQNYIILYTTQGQVIRRISHDQIKGPISVEQSDDDIISASPNVLIGSESGLFLVSYQGDMLMRLKAGMFSDVCVHNKQMAALEYGPQNHCQVILFMQDRSTNWSSYSCVPFQVQNIDKFSGLLLRDKAIYVCPSNNHTIYVHNRVTGSVELQTQSQSALTSHSAVQNVPSVSNNQESASAEFHISSNTSTDTSTTTQFGAQGKGSSPGQLYFPMLCGQDKHGSLLIADCHNRQFQLLHLSGQWQVVAFGNKNDTMEAVVIADGSTIWVLQNWNKLVRYSADSS